MGISVDKAMPLRTRLILERKSKRFIICSGLFSVLVIGVLDSKIGSELHLAFMYIFPITLVSWFVNQRTGIVLAGICAAIGLIPSRLGDLRYTSDLILAGNLFIKAGALVTVACVTAQLRATFEKVSKAANNDFLTGLPNERGFYELAAYEMDKAFGLEPLALAYIDIEGVKWINHRFGYATGDQMLCSIAQTIRECVTPKDLVGRIGGTAFAVLMPNTTSDGANFILEKIHDALKNERRRYAQPVNFFISAVACRKAPRSVAELMHQAETSMTRMRGNNRDALEVIQLHSVPPLN